MSDDERTFFDALGDELVAAAERRPRPTPAEVRRARFAPARARRLVLLGVAAALVAVLAGTLALTRTSDRASAGVDVAVHDGRVNITLTDLEHDPRRIERAVRATGLDVRIVAVPTGPSLVGKFVGEVAGQAYPPELHERQADGSSFAGFSLPVGWPGHLVIYVGRPALAGEDYRAFPSAFDRGEPLACQHLIGLSATEAARELPNVEQTVLFDPLGKGDVNPDPIPAAEIATSEFAGWKVIGGTSWSATRIVLDITAPADAASFPTTPPSC
jgi:hypothetical protein